MATHTATAPVDTAVETAAWSGGKEPLAASYGKLMMWFFLVSDAFTFSGLLVAYGMIRYSAGAWPLPDSVFASLPFIEGNTYPLVFVGIMTFLLIMSSVTMVMAVEHGHRGNIKGVVGYLVLTIIGGAAFLGCQAWEWSHLIEHGLSLECNPYPVAGATAASHASALVLPVAEGAKHAADCVGPLQFGQLFFLITGFHGFHVFSGVAILVITLGLALSGYFKRKGSYELVEKVGLYWHFVDLVWVFVFTFFYLV